MLEEYMAIELIKSVVTGEYQVSFKKLKRGGKTSSRINMPLGLLGRRAIVIVLPQKEEQVTVTEPVGFTKPDEINDKDISIDYSDEKLE